MEKKAKKNINLYAIYELFGYDLHFFLIIGIYFLTEVKNLTITQFLLLNAVISLFTAIFQIPTGIITDKVGRKQCVVLGNLFFMLFGIVLMLGNHFFSFAIAAMFLGIGYSLKSAAETPLLIDSLTLLKKQDEFGKFEGKAFAIYSYVSCALALVSGYIYTINNYLPIILMILFAFFAFVFSLFFTNIELKEGSDKKSSTELQYLKECAKHLFFSKRLKSLLFFVFAFAGILVISIDFSKIALQETGISVTLFGVIQAIFCLFVGFGSQLQFKLEQKLKKKTLTVLSIVFIISFIIIGILGFLDIISNLQIILLVLIVISQRIVSGIYGISSQKYFTNFTSQQVRGKMISILYLVQELGATTFLALSTLVLDKTESIYKSYMILGAIFLVLFIFILGYMRKRVGLEPDEYTRQDLKFDTLL